MMPLLFLGFQPVFAEPPTWDEVASLIYLDFRHMATPVVHGDAYAGGIWAFDPNLLRGYRVRHFDATAYGGIDMAYYGQDLHLETENGLLVIQTWPTELRFEPGVWRLIGRWPTTPAESLLATYPGDYPYGDMQGEIGWTLQGPILTIDEIEGTGLEAGVFGVPECIHAWITGTMGWGGPPTHCMGFAPYQDGDPVDHEGPLLMWSADSPPNPYGAEVVRGLPWNARSFNGGISWDSLRKGFWYGIRRPDQSVSFSLFPVQGAQVMDPGSDFDLNLDIPLDRYLDLYLLYFDPNSQALLGHGVLRKFDDHFDSYVISFLADTTNFDRVQSPTVQNSGNPNIGIIHNPLSGWIPQFPLIDPWDPLNPDIDFEDATPVSATAFRHEPKVHEQLVPIVAETDGRHGSHWTTDLWFFNPSDEEISVTIRRLSNAAEERFVLAPHASRKIPSVLSWMGGGESGDGNSHDAMYISAPFRIGEQLRIDGRIWTSDPQTGGAFGHALQAVPSPFGYSNHGQYARPFGRELWWAAAPFQLFSAFLQLDERIPGQFRHNVGVVNPYDEDLELALMWGYQDSVSPFLYQDPYSEEARVLLRIPSKSVRIFDIKSLFPYEVTSTWPARVGVLGNKAAPVWFSMIDEKTQDATFVPFTNYQVPALQYTERRQVDGEADFFEFDRSFRLALPAVAHTTGVNRSNWTTTLYGYMGPNQFESGERPIVAFHPGAEESCSGGEAQYLQGVMASDPGTWTQYVEEQNLGRFIGEGSKPFRNIFPDVIRRVSGCETVERVRGGLEVVTGSWFSGFSRTSTTRDDGGTYGSMLPLYPAGGWPIQHFAGIEISDVSRINLGFFNGDHDHAISHRVSLFDGTGLLVAEREFILDSLDSRQMEIHAFFEGFVLPEGSYGLTVLPLDGFEADGTWFRGHSWAYISIIDNRSNDPFNLW